MSALKLSITLAWKAEKEALHVRRWTQTFTGLMPPFKSWMPPKVIAQAAAWGDSVLGREAPASKEELSTLKYSFPDALPKVILLAACPQHAVLATRKPFAWAHLASILRNRHCQFCQH